MRRALAALAAAALLSSTAGVAPAGAFHQESSLFALHLNVDGSADVVLTERYNLSNDSERRAFERFEGNETARERRLSSFRERLRRGAQRGQSATGREMAIRNATVDARRFDNGTAHLVLNARWEGLAAVVRHPDGDFLSVTEPFASGFAVNRTFAVFGPEGFVRAEGGMNPPPALARKNSAFWPAGEDLSGFEATFTGDLPGTPTATATADASDGGSGGQTGAGGSGAFLLAAVIALVPTFLVALALRRVE